MKDIVIFPTDNNGQVSKNTENENKTIGKWATAKENSKGNGRKPARYCKNNLFIANTFFSPKKQTSKTSSQIDYIAVSGERRNWVTNAR